MNELINEVSEYNKTNNYSIFELLPFNRDIKKTSKLEQSMIKHGYINSYPLHVKKGKNGKLVIKGGHHRFTVAKNLGLTVSYVISNDVMSVHEGEESTVRWSINDYLMSYVRLEFKDYMDVLDYQQRTGISLSLCAALLAGNTANATAQVLSKFKKGTYKINRNSNYANLVEEFVNILKQLSVEVATDAKLINALSRIIVSDVCDLNNLKNKIEKNYYLITKRATSDLYLELFALIYNKGTESKNQMDLKFKVINAMKEIAKRNLSK